MDSLRVFLKTWKFILLTNIIKRGKMSNIGNLDCRQGADFDTCCERMISLRLRPHLLERNVMFLISSSGFQYLLNSETHHFYVPYQCLWLRKKVYGVWRMLSGSCQKPLWKRNHCSQKVQMWPLNSMLVVQNICYTPVYLLTIRISSIPVIKYFH